MSKRLKALMLEIIGEDEDDKMISRVVNDVGIYEPAIEATARNELRAQLRKKAEIVLSRKTIDCHGASHSDCLLPDLCRCDCHTQGIGLAASDRTGNTNTANPPLSAPTNTDELIHDYCKAYIDENIGLQWAELKLKQLVALKQREELEDRKKLVFVRNDGLRSLDNSLTRRQIDVILAIFDDRINELNTIIEGEK